MSWPAATEGGFPETRWTRVLAVREGVGGTPDSDRALSELCETYWLPIYAYARRQGETPHEAEDSTQEFFGMVLTRELFHKAQPQRGRLRSFLLGSFQLFRAERIRGARRLKRGGGRQFVPLDEAVGEELLRDAPALVTEPTAEFDRLWAQTVLRRTLRRLEDDYDQRHQLALFDRLRGFLGMDGTSEDSTALADSLRMTPGALRVAIFRLRKRFRTLLEEEVADTLSSSDKQSVEDEIRYLARALPADDASLL